MRFVSTIIGSALALAVSACGMQSKKDDQQAAQPAPTAAEQKTAQEIPAAAIVRVPVDEKGNPVGQPEMKVLQSGEVADSENSVTSAFDNGAAPQKVVKNSDELDGDTSTQSWSAYANYSSSSYGSSSYGGTSVYGGGNGGGYGGGNGGGYGGGNGGGYGGGSYGGGNGGGYNSGCGSCSSYNYNYFYNSYKPVLYYHGYGWNYGVYQPYHYNNGGYSYYCYRPYRERSYGSYGY